MMKIWLSDLTYTQQTISSDVVPAAIGMLAEYIEKELGSKKVDIKLFKYPEDLIQELHKNEIPDLFGVSNYIWNHNLSSLFTKIIKDNYPKTITVMGGPNFPTNENEQKEFLIKEPWLDYYIIKEGEYSLLKLIKFLMKEEKSIEEVPNLVYLKKNKFYSSPKIERIMDLTLIPSPYLSGRLDNFLDGRLMPVIQTNRGCPFSCTFCTEGQTYWSKVRRKEEKLITGEIEWISDLLTKSNNKNSRSDLLIADSNFGMFNEDIKTCEVIANQQKTRGYPKYINVATGKNRKEKVLEAAKILDGALKLAGSVQSLDEDVQKNIKRSNISSTGIMEMALNANEIGANTYSEVILGLPGDSFASHEKTLKTLVDSSFNTISMYQLMMLPGTELNTIETRKNYKMKTGFRVLPRCFGYFEVFDKEYSVAEIEEILISNSTLSYSDYLKGRELDFFVNVFYNDAIFDDLFILFKKINVSIWDWLYFLFKNYSKFEFKNLVNDFIDETENELSSKKKLIEKISKKENIEKFINGELGNNLMFKYKSLSLTKYSNPMFNMVENLTKRFLKKKKIFDNNIKNLVKEIILFNKLKIVNIFSEKKSYQECFSFNILKLKAISNFSDIKKLNNKDKFNFIFENVHQNEINNYLELFGSDTKGLTRILSRVYLKNLFRSPRMRQS